jgi:hypothetical protein
MYNKDQNIDRRHCMRKVPMQVLALGYSRTGTLSMQKALEILGYPTYHFSSIYDNAREGDLWMQAIDAKFNGKGNPAEFREKKFWDGMLGHVSAVTDAPCLLFAQELMGCYPEAKVVLVERDIDSWMGSWMKFCESAFDPALIPLLKLEPYWLGRIAGVGVKMMQPLTNYSKNLDEVRVRSRDAYRHHYRDVREQATVKGIDLLDYNYKDGWEPLCKFLGKPIPTVPFPHENDTERNRQSFVELQQKTIKTLLRRLAMLLSVIGVPALASWYYLRTR